MSDLGSILTASITLYAITTGAFLIAENRRPQATLAWMLAFIAAPVIGVVIYILFGRSRKAFAKQKRILKQDLEAGARPLLSPLLSRQNRSITRLEGKSPSHRKLMMLVRWNSQSALTTGNRVEILQNADSFYPSLVRDLKAAQHSIHLQYFIWRADRLTEELKSILTEKARSGVEVRLLYDPVGSFVGLSWSYIKEMQEAGVQMAPTSPLYQLHTISYRNHRKITVIDGNIGYTGGMNIGQEHLDGGDGYDTWRDTQLRIVGEGTALLQAVFVVDWYNAVREDLFFGKYFATQALARHDEEVPVQILPSGPDSQWEAIRQLYAFMITTAQRHVYLQSPYFILDATVAEALQMAALAGTDVKVMLNAPGPRDVVAGWAANTFIMDVVNAGVQVFLYERGYLHAKTISIDSTICSIGSANMDIRSFSINYELNAVIYSDRLTKQLEDIFQRDLENCRVFTPLEYHRRNIAVRFRDSATRLLSPLL
jgi:cardiolipin synthase